MVPRSEESDLGRYHLVRLLGRGGMGEVYLAEDRQLGREVAIKFVSADHTADPDARRRLLREAQSAAVLDHPGICVVYEVGEAPDGRAFIVMQHVEGQPLSETLALGPLPVRESLSLCAHVAEALGAAHRQRIVHRDLKPGNIMITPSGRPKLLDFGIAKVVTTMAAVSESSTASNGTTHGAIVGTPAYMSPEQVQQRPLDARSDLFSLGVVLFECLTGRRPFDGPTAVETIANILRVEPPAPSALCPGLSEAHDELCWRLLAKDPDDRFQSADEVVGAVRLLTGETHTHRVPALPMPWWRRRRPIAVVTLLAVLGIGTWLLNRPRPLPSAPAYADDWYKRGTDAIRRGSYVSGRRALEEAVRVFPSYALARARLAEAHAELDDLGDARDQLLRVSVLVPNEARLPQTERLRLQALRSLVLRDVDQAVRQYGALAVLQPDDAGASLDLGRALEAAGFRAAARNRYRRAIQQDGQYAAAHLRLGYLESLEFRKDAALSAFAEAERLYRAASDVEGETEVLLRRGTMRESFIELKEARADLERALSLATASDVEHQQIRARLSLSSVAASRGEYGEAERIANAAVQEALAAGMDVIAAEGLVELGATLAQAERAAEAAAALERALQLAENRGAARTAARARLQLAAVRELEARPRETLALLDEALPFVRANRFRRFEFYGLLLAARAHQQLDALPRARQAAEGVLALAEILEDQGQLAYALSNLANVATALGSYPEALGLRERAEVIARNQADQATLPNHLANRAELLILLGRASEAEPLLAELDAGIASGTASFVARGRQAAFLRALATAVALTCEQVPALAARIGPPASEGDVEGVLTPAVAAFCEARGARRAAPAAGVDAPALPALARERLYWLAAAALQRGEPATALADASRGLGLLADLPHHELRWRLASVAAIAARRLKDEGRLAEMTARSREADQALAAAWSSAYETFARRPDIAHLKRLAAD